MPLTPKGEEIMAAMQKQYGAKKGKSVFYASANTGKIKGVHHSPPAGVDAFDGRSTSLIPVPISIEKGVTHADAFPVVTGRPGGNPYGGNLAQTDGTGQLRSNPNTSGPNTLAYPAWGQKEKYAQHVDRGDGIVPGTANGGLEDDPFNVKFGVSPLDTYTAESA